MDKLQVIAKVVKLILTENPQARNNDDLLYIETCKVFNPSIEYFPFGVVFRNSASYCIPNYKSVERARRKIQREYPELASDRKIKQLRTEKETEYKAFTKEGAV